MPTLSSVPLIGPAAAPAAPSGDLLGELLVENPDMPATVLADVVEGAWCAAASLCNADIGAQRHVAGVIARDRVEVARLRGAR